jgi:hypothetical protein
MARNPAGAPAVTTWARSAGRLIADKQPLLLFPIASGLLQVLLILPLVLATRNATTFDAVARDSVFAESRIVDLLGGGHLTGPTIAAGTAFLLGQAALRAWLGGAFIRSIDAERIVWTPGGKAFRRLILVYLASEAFLLLGIGPLGLFAAVAGFALFGYADYVVVFEGRPAPDAVRRSLQAMRAAPVVSALIFVGLYVFEALVYLLFIVPINDASHVSLPLFGALILLDGLVGYVSDCSLIAVLYGARFGKSR